ncbi:MAG: response regulator [Desulfobulbaceae bacterium]|nr:response regulator [Desulfobulbaceae bacterium]HIJ89984.1 response regulator [Deltaproteobacteria bacterium]
MNSPVAADDSRKDIRILVVEDVDFNREILADILADRCWLVVTAASGEAALDILAQDADFQIILMDIGLPGIDGMETTRRIKKNPATRAIPVIALTAETADEQEHFLAAGLDGYVEKNFDPDQLFAAIEKHLFLAGGNRHDAHPNTVNPEEYFDLDYEALLAIYTDEKTLCRIARAFFTDTDKELVRLGEAMAQDDQAGILACCHSLGGSSAIFTAKKLGMAVKDLDDCVRHEKKDEIESAWRRVLFAHESLRGSVSRRLNLSI